MGIPDIVTMTVRPLNVEGAEMTGVKVKMVYADMVSLVDKYLASVILG